MPLEFHVGLYIESGRHPACFDPNGVTFHSRGQSPGNANATNNSPQRGDTRRLNARRSPKLVAIGVDRRATAWGAPNTRRASNQLNARALVARGIAQGERGGVARGAMCRLRPHAAGEGWWSRRNDGQKPTIELAPIVELAIVERAIVDNARKRAAGRR